MSVKLRKQGKVSPPGGAHRAPWASARVHQEEKTGQKQRRLTGDRGPSTLGFKFQVSCHLSKLSKLLFFFCEGTGATHKSHLFHGFATGRCRGQVVRAPFFRVSPPAQRPPPKKKNCTVASNCQTLPSPHSAPTHTPVRAPSTPSLATHPSPQVLPVRWRKAEVASLAAPALRRLPTATSPREFPR